MNTDHQSADKSEDAPFFIGYQPMPKGLKAPVLGAVLAFVLLAVGAAALIAVNQRDPGTGLWAFDRPVTMTGRLEYAPYPLLLVDGGEESWSGKVAFLSLVGKLGVQDYLNAYKGDHVALTGFRIEREGMVMLEVIEAEDAVDLVASRAPDNPFLDAEPVSLGPQSLQGEIIDSKCFLGVMKPGDGKVHKACATVCVVGGIPPMFVGWKADGTYDLYLITDPDGRAIVTTPGEAVSPLLDYIADYVSVEGEVVDRGGRKELRLDPTTIVRL